MSTASVAEVLAAPPQTTGIYSNPNFTHSDGFVHKGRRYSMFPAIVAQEPSAVDPLRAHQFSHWRSLSVPSTPLSRARDHVLQDIPEAVQPKWPAERFYAKYRQATDASQVQQRAVKQKPTFNRIVNKVYNMFPQRRVRDD
jgi:hypothetical protein